MEKKFSETLVFLADLTGKNLNEQIYDFYLHHLKPIGLDRVIPVLLNYATKSKWPSIQDILKDLGVSTENIDLEQEAEIYVRKIGKLVENPGGSSERHCIWAKEAMTDEEWKIVNLFMSWPTLTNGDVVDPNRLQFELLSLKKYYIAHKQKQSFEKHQELIGIETKSNTVIQPLLDSKFQKMIDEIPF